MEEKEREGKTWTFKEDCFQVSPPAFLDEDSWRRIFFFWIPIS
jgi:hypothetical protein